MFGLFKKKDENVDPQLTATLNDTQHRWFSFLDKLEHRMQELCDEAVPALKAMLEADEDTYDRTFLKLRSGIEGQLESIRHKADEVYESEIMSLYYGLGEEMNVLHPQRYLLDDFKEGCIDRYQNKFDAQYQQCRQRIDEASRKDLEKIYNAIVAEYELIKNKFNCSQCGAAILIEKMFFIDTYITCPSCNTKNSYAPGTQARSLEHIARGLAEQRTAHLHKIWQEEQRLERELYMKCHELSLSTIHEKDKKVLAQKEAEMAALEERRQQAITNDPVMYRQYLRAMYDEWSRIIPDFKEHHEKMYQSQIKNLQD